MQKTIANAVTAGIAVLLILYQSAPVLAGGPVERKEGKPFSSNIITYAHSGFCDSVSEIPILECEALEALYNSTDGDNWTDSTSWLVTDTPCSTPWFGVTCSGGHVIDLDLYFNQLSGSLPPELGNLSILVRISLYNNQLSGGIPPELGGLSSLKGLYLHFNQLSGSLPPELGDLSSLLYLYLDDNQLSEGIPPELGDLSSLLRLNLYNNQLSGSIPPELGNLSSLQHFSLYNNQLRGSIPPELGNLSSMWELSLGSNQLSGSIPPELGNLSSMRELSLGSNQLSGSIPPELGNLSNLQYLQLHSNQLSGSIPPEIGNLSGLQYLSLSNNQLSGEIPASLTNLINLGSYRIGIGYNMLTASDQSLIAFLNETDPDWAETQTVPPTNIRVKDVYTTGLVLAWTPISYTLDGGYYEVSYATTSGGPYTVHGTTADKTASSYTFDSLSADIDYYFVLRTFTPAHIYQQNDLWSAYSQEAFTHNYQLFLPIAVRQQ